MPKRLSLAALPTRLHALPRLSQHVGREIWIKRDDETGLGLGGNKARKLEYLMADAVEQEADTIITVGGIQSNHARMTAAAAASLGLDCHLVLRGLVDEPQGNLLLDALFGAVIHCIPPERDREAKMEQLAGELRRDGRKPYCIGVGGSSGLGSLGYFDAVCELKTQLPDTMVFEEIVTAVGSGGTYAGLAMGLKAHGIPGRLQGIAVDDMDFLPIILDIAADASVFGLPSLEASDVFLDSGSLGPGYGRPSDEGCEAIDLLATLEGILLDPVYTGKAMAALLRRFSTDENRSGGPVLFWHTGGAPSLFAFRDALTSRKAPGV